MEKRVCLVCAREFMPTWRSFTILCSTICQYVRRKQQQEKHQMSEKHQAYRIKRSNAVIRSARLCLICKTKFTPRGQGCRKKACSDLCKKTLRRQCIRRHRKTEKAKATHKRWRMGPTYRAYISRPDIKLYHTLRNVLNTRIMVGDKRTSLFLTYSRVQLMAHLEMLFLPGMTWKNYGKKGWHIDHIKPLSAFVFFTALGKLRIGEVRKAMALSNLQPLWAADNIRKGGAFGHDKAAATLGVLRPKIEVLTGGR